MFQKPKRSTIPFNACSKELGKKKRDVAQKKGEMAFASSNFLKKGIDGNSSLEGSEDFDIAPVCRRPCNFSRKLDTNKKEQ